MSDDRAVLRLRAEWEKAARRAVAAVLDTAVDERDDLRSRHHRAWRSRLAARVLPGRRR